MDDSANNATTVAPTVASTSAPASAQHEGAQAPVLEHPQEQATATNNPPTLIINEDWKEEYEKDLIPLNDWEKKAIQASKVHDETVAAPQGSNIADFEGLYNLEEGLGEFETLHEGLPAKVLKMKIDMTETGDHDRFFRLQFDTARGIGKDRPFVIDEAQNVHAMNDWPTNHYSAADSHFMDGIMNDFGPTIFEKTDKNGRDFIIFENPLTLSLVVVVTKVGANRFVLLNNVLLPLKDLLNLESCVETLKTGNPTKNADWPLKNNDVDGVSVTLTDKRVFEIKEMNVRLMTAVLSHLSSKYASPC
jgi:hypothetical protein